MEKSIVVIGGGILGLAICAKLTARRHAVSLVEKESNLATHQSGSNSGVIHAGPYYKPGSLKARLCALGNQQMAQFAEFHGIPFKITGKLLLATKPHELPRLRAIAERAVLNGVPSEIIGPEQIHEIEPAASRLSALHVKNTGIIDYRKVAEKLAELSLGRGAEILTGAEVRNIRHVGQRIAVEHTRGSCTADLLINAAGLQSDRIAQMAGLKPKVRIIPFRGEYFELDSEARHWVKGLIYPVPDPSLPFLGVHLTKLIGGEVHAGPNAVLALAREGYQWSDVNARDLLSTLSFPGLPALAARNVGVGIREVVRSFSTRLFAKDLSRLVPGIEARHLVPSQSGVRAQAVDRKGRLVDDFVIHRTDNQMHILNAPSPAATASLAIADYIVSSL